MGAPLQPALLPQPLIAAGQIPDLESAWAAEIWLSYSAPLTPPRRSCCLQTITWCLGPIFAEQSTWRSGGKIAPVASGSQGFISNAWPLRALTSGILFYGKGRAQKEAVPALGHRVTRWQAQDLSV